jgi:hypothetical protein
MPDHPPGNGTSVWPLASWGPLSSVSKIIEDRAERLGREALEAFETRARIGIRWVEGRNLHEWAPEDDDLGVETTTGEMQQPRWIHPGCRPGAMEFQGLEVALMVDGPAGQNCS